jgi:hypothetical protein
MGKKPRLHDGYILRDSKVIFYSDSTLYKITSGKQKHPKVDEDKVMEYEGLCASYQQHFMNIGWLRLHTPVDEHQEKVGINFLSVPLKHRARIAEMLKGGTLIMLDELKTFYVFETGEQITFEQLLGDGELFDFVKVAQENHDKLDSGAITKEEWEKCAQVIVKWEKEKFHIESFCIDGMFVEK